MRWFSPSALRVWQRNRDVFFALSRSEVPGTFVEPLLVLFAMGLGLGAYVGLINGQQYIEFITPGIIAGYAMYSATFECTYGSFWRLDYQKTYDAIIATPLSIEDVVAGEILWGATRALITTGAVLVIAAAFGLIHTPIALLVLPMGLLSGLMFASIAFTFTSIAPAISSFNYFFTLFVTPMFYFSGVFFPLDAFPETVQKLSWIAPLTPVAGVTRSLVQGELSLSLLWPLVLILGITTVFFCLSLVLMRRRLLK
ncbi:MAG: ABC transporter permease [Dehalococcoidia bacterium]|nr:Inner membrane transport permease YadH [Chloroflexota bacterium]MBT9158995.1 Inner membrane transport permease YadH [Chloroflexota bacterium]MBT9162777.1 Inner membrane transport permease YadH [Chloroflexota bacterium]